MKTQHRKTLIASMVVALAGAPAWVLAAGEYGAGTTGQSSEHMTGRSAGQPGQMTGTEAGQLTSKTPNELEGKKVVTAAGQEVGTVEAIVSSRAQDKPYAVISSGGFLGIGDKEIVVSLDQLSMSGDQLQVNVSEEELKTSPEYMRDQYVEVEPEDQPISEFSAFETEQPGTMQQRQPGESGRVHESPTGKELSPADPRQSSDIAPDRGDLPEQRY